MTKSLILICLMLAFEVRFCFAQKSKIENLERYIQTAKEDTNKAIALKNLCWLYKERDPKKALEYGNVGLFLAEKLKFKRGIADCFNNIGVVNNNIGNFDLALSFHLKSLKIREELDDKNGIAMSLGNIGSFYQNTRKYDKALDYFNQCIKVFEELDKKKEVATTWGNIGIIYYYKGEYESAINNLKKSLFVYKLLGDKLEIARSLNNIGGIYQEQRKVKESVDFFQQALKIYTDIGGNQGIANCSNNIGTSLVLMGKFNDAIEYFQKGLLIAKKLGSKDDIKESYHGLAESYAKQNNGTKSLEYFILYDQIKDSIFNQESNKQSADMSEKYQSEKKQKEIELLNKDKILQAEELKKNRIITLSFISGFLLMVILAFVIFTSLQQKKKANKLLALQKQEIEHQKYLVEEHQKEIIDSITYAKRLQQAILPSNEEIKKHLPESFIFYKPKDIVAGDFYWLHVSPNEELVFIAAADSTGHGVPGAMVSVVCSNALNRAVNEFNLIETGTILDKTRDLVLETFAKSGEEIKDGMDISLLAINKETKQISWSGANNQLCYFQNDRLIQIKANKQAIGKTDNPQPFTTHSIEFKIGLTFYLMTDGFADQFGGEKGKKYKHKQLQESLISTAILPLSVQKEKLALSFDNWKGNLEQVDDVTIIGIRI